LTPSRTRITRSGSRGNYRIDRRFPLPVGRFNISSGVSDAKRFRQRDQLLSDLWAEGQVDTLLALKAGRVTFEALLQMKKVKRLDSASLLADLRLKEALWDSGDTLVSREGDGAVSRTIDGMSCAESSKERYRVSWRQLAKVMRATGELGVTPSEKGSGVPSDAPAIPGARRMPVSALKSVPWGVLVQAWETSPANKNRAYAALSAFLSAFLGDKRHPVRSEILKLWGKLATESAEPRDLSVPEFWTLMEHVPELAVPSYVTLAASGMRVGEYLHPSIRLLETRHEIETKGKTGRKRYSVAPELWPFVKASVPCTVARAPKQWNGVQRDARYKRLRQWMTEASEATEIPATIHYLRHLYAAIGTDHASLVAVQHALGQRTPGVTAGYAKRRESAGVAKVVGDVLSRKGA
jgi:hypothetical protein